MSKRRGAFASASLVAAVGAVLVLAGGEAAASTSTLWVSPSGSDGNACTHAKPCRTIGRAVSVAPVGATIMVTRGVYKGGVTIAKRLHLVGTAWPTVNASGATNGIVLAGSGASGSSISGLRVVNASQEGILAIQTSWVTIRGNVVAHNDQGMFAAKPTGECAPQGQVPGDCGEGIHLMTVNHARVLSNQVTANAGGILATDEFGPTFGNVIGWNHIWANAYDCGITMPGHSPFALSSTGVLQPTMGGVYDNLVTHNVVTGNGLKGEGAGILIAAAAPGSGSYGNVISWNAVSGNNLAGITVHSHAPNQDVNGNRFIGNVLSHNNLGGDPDAGLMRTADLVVFSAVAPITGTVARGNTFTNAFFGVWSLNGHVSLAGNTYHNVRYRAHQG